MFTDGSSAVLTVLDLGLMVLDVFGSTVLYLFADGARSAVSSVFMVLDVVWRF